ncbi:MAG: TIGR04255 family protein [Methanobrevibacter sp.]|jgi:uncharacterized protein (TIGR04255 family)|nr:TIGR04255 family protein [Candidatus Methanovirga meridionalis]
MTEKTYKENYKKNYLTRVIFEVKFPPILGLRSGDDLYVSTFQKMIVDKFPYSEIKKGEEITLNIPPSQITGEREKITSWLFKDDAIPKKIVTLDYNKIVLLYNKEHYTTFSDFLETIELIFDALGEYPVRKVEYVGMRYINQIDENKNLEDLIDEKLHITSGFVDQDDILKYMHSLVFKKEDYMINFNFGYPNPMPKKEFVLDYICSYKESTDIDDVSNIAKKMNKIIKECFEKSILNGLREIMDKGGK